MMAIICFGFITIYMTVSPVALNGFDISLSTLLTLIRHPVCCHLYHRQRYHRGQRRGPGQWRKLQFRDLVPELDFLQHLPVAHLYVWTVPDCQVSC